MLFLALSAISCKKEKQTIDDPAPTGTTSAAIWNMNKTWQVTGYRITNVHRSNDSVGTKNGRYYDTIASLSLHIKVLDDSTMYIKAPILGNSDILDTLSIFMTDSAAGYIEYIPPVFKRIGTRYRPNYLKYYFHKDSIQYFFNEHGTSFNDSLMLWSM